ncbi:MAG: alpha-ketoglutarate dehydrogenase [Vulcanimicrobiaceae bacterium]
MEAKSHNATSDADPGETHEWLEALAAIVSTSGKERAAYLLKRLNDSARELGLVDRRSAYSAYQNTVSIEDQGPYPGDLAIEERLTSIVRWNALAMVVRANKAYGELGGHVASYASAAEIFEVGFNHFFRAPSDGFGGDLVFYQPHSAPGVYARAYLEGRLSEERLANFRRELGGNGLSSYPHPWLMPEFWQFPTGSMGLGPITSIYHARFARYLEHRGIAVPSDRRVWGVFGDGEMDEPESIAALTLAAREKLDNLTWIVNCNLQRLDGPVRGNGQIIQELEALFTGAGWNVVKVLWGSEWDGLFARDKTRALLRNFAATVDGQYQTLGANDGAYNAAHFFDLDPDLQTLVSSMSPTDIDGLRRGGHDFRKLYAAFDAARRHEGRPTVILAKTKKGYGVAAAESKMGAHQQKKLDIAALRTMRDRFDLPLTDADLEEMRFYKPSEDSIELKYLRDRRSALGGNLPARRRTSTKLATPPLDDVGSFAVAADGKEMSTTVVLVRILNNLLRDKDLGPRIVPIVADEARTFGMDNMFRQIGIYSPLGQLYEPQDAASMLFYREAKDGQLLEEGINEAGALSSWIAAATSYSVHGQPMLPFYIFYSMFGFQRVGDLIWAAADQRSRGFLIGATAGRTTLGGEGLQHQDGSSHVIAATVPNCRAYDPAFAYEVAVIVDYGSRQMMTNEEDVFYYLTVMNENYAHPSMPPDAYDDIIRGMHRVRAWGLEGTPKRVRLLGSGAIVNEILAAADILRDTCDVDVEVWSVTSFSELAREAQAVDRWNRLHAAESPRVSHVERSLEGDEITVVATDYVRAYPSSIAPYVRGDFVTLGTDGFGRSDTRDGLRRFFEVDRHAIVLAALHRLRRRGHIPPSTIADFIGRAAPDVDASPPWNR